jgi:hypothetical protein
LVRIRQFEDIKIGHENRIASSLGQYGAASSTVARICQFEDIDIDIDRKKRIASVGGENPEKVFC